MLAGNMVPPPGTYAIPAQWLADGQYGLGPPASECMNGFNAECIWQYPNGGHGFSAWVQPSKAPIPFHVRPEIMMLQNEDSSDSSSQSPNGTVTPPSTPEPRRVQSAARAAKRQRGRERRKLYKAAAHASKCLEAPADHKRVSGYDSPIGGFEARAAAVNAQIKLVVKSTFFDVELEDASTDDEVQLPSAFFETTPEIDGWRRDYRRFRLGHHQGAKGELTENLTPRSV